METQIFKSYEDFLNRPDKTVNGVSEDFAKANPNYGDDNSNNTGCWNCSECRNCKDCEWCKRCYYCENCYECEYCQNRSGRVDCKNLN